MLLKYAIGDFIQEKQFNNLSNYTITTYRRNLTEFQNYCLNEKVINVNDITRVLVKSYLNYVREEKNNKVSTLNNKIRSLKSFFNFLIDEEILEIDNPMKKIKQVKEEINIPIPTEEQITKIIRYYERYTRKSPFVGIRNRHIIITLISVGIRRSELATLKWSNVNFIQNTISVFGKKRKLVSSPMSNKLKNEMAAYKVFCEQYFGKLPEYVFCTNKGKQMSIEGITTIFKRLAKIMDFDTRLSAHSFRHVFTKQALQSGLDVASLKAMLHHENSAMVFRYANMWGTALHELNEKHNPLNNFDID
ncbi:tyrosine-type recombinase/integrase [Bacillus seohaeanensis]|uniref:Tyrosine-type recombinase/integrase n=1 Tax=Bacillus seohaeanensis TaxID=284580 RepID=A0ABW5RS94_9BACI